MNAPHTLTTHTEAAAAVARRWRGDLQGIPRGSTLSIELQRKDLERLTTLAEAVAGLGAAVDQLRQIVERLEQTRPAV